MNDASYNDVKKDFITALRIIYREGLMLSIKYRTRIRIFTLARFPR